MDPLTALEREHIIAPCECARGLRQLLHGSLVPCAGCATQADEMRLGLSSGRHETYRRVQVLGIPPVWVWRLVSSPPPSSRRKRKGLP
jgi:hypothetical protein